MVITMVWVPSWSVPIISISILFVAVLFLLCCFCIQKKRSETLHFGISTRKKFLNISNNSLNKLMTFRKSEVLPTLGQEKQSSESDLLESEDTSNRFTSSRLRVDDPDDLDQEDVRSCASNDSRFTFYSTYPCFTRSGSMVSDTTTYKSTRNSMKTLPIEKSCSDLFIA